MYITPRTYLVFIATAGLLVLAHFVPWMLLPAKIVLFTLLLLAVADLVFLFAPAHKVEALRELPERFSNGDQNPVTLRLRHSYPQTLQFVIYDEIPVKLQLRNFYLKQNLKPATWHEMVYHLRPTERGVYGFGRILVYAGSRVGLWQRRFAIKAARDVAVYPSFLQMRRYQLMAATDRLHEQGIQKIRQLSHSHEFDQIREYVHGDDLRSINWKATARHAGLMVNQYQAERAQPIYNLIDTGRQMKMPFDGMSLLDYAINASLVISAIAMDKKDKAGLMAFSKAITAQLPARRGKRHLLSLMEGLYRIRTDYDDTNYEKLYAGIQRHIGQRSLVLLYTNFVSVQSMRRQMTILRALAKKHVLVVIFFKNTGLGEMIGQDAETIRQVYQKITSERFAYEKELMVRELHKYSIHSLLVEPSQLNTEVLNKYLQLKAKGLI